MAETAKIIPFDEFADNLNAFFDRVVRDREIIVVEREDGEAVVLEPAKATGRRKRKRTAADHEAFLSTAGGWKGLVDTDKLVEDIYLSRSMPPRPPVRF